MITSFGAGIFVLPHGLHVDRDGNVWVTDSKGNEAGNKGHQVIKFSPDGEILLRLGTAGQPGNAPGQLNEPCDVITAPNGDIFVADGHSGQSANPPAGATGRYSNSTARETSSRNGGKSDSGPASFARHTPLAFDTKGRLFVADRGNNRIQIFNQDGKLLDTYFQFSRVSGLFITTDDTLYAIDSESKSKTRPGWKTGIRIGNAAEDRATAYIPPHPSQTRWFEGVARRRRSCRRRWQCLCRRRPGLSQSCQRGNYEIHAEAASLVTGSSLNGALNARITYLSK